MIIDAHAHIYPDKIAEKATAAIGEFYDLNMHGGSGTVDGLLKSGGEAGVERFIVQSVATIPEQVVSINNFLHASVAQHPDKLIGFCAMHPDFPDPKAEIDRCISLGFKGIKLHPDFQKFNIDDERAFPIYEAAEGRLPILFHTGDYRYDYSHPRRLYNVTERFPNLTVIGAHFGGWSLQDTASYVFRDRKIYVDCSSSLYFISPEHAAELIRRFGADHVLWGTDYPMWNAKEELERFYKLPLTDEERELILYKNALRLIGEE